MLQPRFNFSHWNHLQNVSNPELHDLVSTIPDVVNASKCSSTIKKYNIYFKKFKDWCSKYGLSFLPASVCTIAIYLNFLIQSEVSVSVLNAAFYAKKWEHDLNLVEGVMDDNFLKMILEGGTRLLSKPLVKKEPITPKILQQIVDKYGNTNRLPDLRICAIMLLGYAGFLRYSEISNIKASNISFFDSHAEITIEKSKTDVYRQGNVVVLAFLDSNLCPVSMLKKYLKAANILTGTNQYIFRSLSFRKSSNEHVLCNLNKPLSYTRAREILLDALSEIGLEKTLFGLHSLRSGAASAAAQTKYPTDCSKLMADGSQKKQKTVI